MTGFCSKCHKVWTADTAQAVCQWCGKQAICLTSDVRQPSGFLKATSRRRKQKQANDSPAYDELPDPWSMYAQVAKMMKGKVPDQDQGDIQDEIIARCADRQVRYKGFAVTVAKQAIVDHWRRERYRQMASLDWEIVDTEGNKVKVIDTLQAHEQDFEELAFKRDLLANIPVRLIKIATKKVAGYPLTEADSKYLRRFRNDQKQLRLKY